MKDVGGSVCAIIALSVFYFFIYLDVPIELFYFIC